MDKHLKQKARSRETGWRNSYPSGRMRAAPGELNWPQRTSA
jgi:hypothetical protein